MRRPRYVGQAAINDAIWRLLDKFDYPDELGQGGDLILGGGGAPTFVVAASDATEVSKSKADFVCTGVGDEEVIAAALLQATNATDGFAGRVLLTEGYFQIASTSEIFVRSGQTLEGLSPRGTHLAYTGPASTGAALIEMQGGARVTALRIDELGGDMAGNLGIEASAGTGPAYVDYVEMDHDGEGMVISPERSVVAFCDLNLEGKGIYVEGDASLVRDCTIQTFVSHAIEVQDATRVRVLDNHIRGAAEHGIALTEDISGCSECWVRGNQITDVSLDGSNLFDGINLSGTAVENYVLSNWVISDPGLPARYGINISSGVCNIVVGNNLGSTTNYGSDAINDAGADTQLFWPADATYGDNFIGCYGS